MPPRWYRSLYWRIAFGFMLALAAMLVVQGLLFVLAVSRVGPALPGQPPDRFAQTVALDVGGALDNDPKLNIAQFIRDQFGRDAHPFFIMLKDGRVISNGGATFPEPLLRLARIQLERWSTAGNRLGPRGGPDWRMRGFPGRDGPPGEGRGRGGFGGPGGPANAVQFRPPRPAPIVANGQLEGVVVVAPRAPFAYLLARYAPTLAIVATAVMVVGAVLASVVIFGPARRRLRAVEDAARRLGAGDLTARAPDQGGDEVSAVATAFNAMARDLGARTDALVQVDRTRRQLLADVSHELNTPVTAIRGYLETLTMADLPLDEVTRTRYLGIIADETSRLEGIIGDLLELARLEGGGGTLTIGDVMVDQLFGRVVARHERTAQNAGVHIVTEVRPDAAIVRGDQNRLEQALQNLAANAVRYAPSGSTVSLVAKPERGGVTLSVTDAGPGITPEHLDRVFDRFYKVEASRARHDEGMEGPGGSGLGLSIVKAIVERHGGRVSVTSRPGLTVFSLWIPAVRPERGQGAGAV